MKNHTNLCLNGLTFHGKIFTGNHRFSHELYGIVLFFLLKPIIWMSLWWFSWATPLINIWLLQLGWWHSQLNGKKKMFQTTNKMFIPGPWYYIIGNKSNIPSKHYVILWRKRPELPQVRLLEKVDQRLVTTGKWMDRLIDIPACSMYAISTLI